MHSIYVLLVFVCDALHLMALHTIVNRQVWFWMLQNDMKPRIECIICNERRLTILVKHREFKNAHIVKCENCGLIFTSPMPAEEFLRKYYQCEYRANRHVINQDYVCSKKVRAISQARFIRRALDARPHYNNTYNVLDIGCGIGILLDTLKQEGMETFGVEPDIAMARYATKNLGLNVEASFFNPENYLTRSFDVICMSHVLEHFRDPQVELRGVRGILKTDGILFVEVPNDNEERIRFKVWKGETAKIAESSHLFFFTPKTLTLMLEISGFNILEIYTNGPPLANIVGNQKTPTVKAGGEYSVYSDPHYIEQYYSMGDNREGVSIRILATPNEILYRF